MSVEAFNDTGDNIVDNNNQTMVDSKKRQENLPKLPVPPDDPNLLQKIEEVRDSLRDDFKGNGAEYWAVDMEKVMSCDYEVRRFLYQTSLDVQQAVQMIKERLRWRKEMGFDQFKPEAFPIEFYECGSVFEFKVR